MFLIQNFEKNIDFHLKNKSVDKFCWGYISTSEYWIFKKNLFPMIYLANNFIEKVVKSYTKKSCGFNMVNLLFNSVHDKTKAFLTF